MVTNLIRRPTTTTDCIPLFVLIQKVEQKDQGEIDAPDELC